MSFFEALRRSLSSFFQASSEKNLSRLALADANLSRNEAKMETGKVNARHAKLNESNLHASKQNIKRWLSLLAMTKLIVACLLARFSSDCTTASKETSCGRAEELAVLVLWSKFFFGFQIIIIMTETQIQIVARANFSFSAFCAKKATFCAKKAASADSSEISNFFVRCQCRCQFCCCQCHCCQLIEFMNERNCCSQNSITRQSALCLFAVSALWWVSTALTSKISNYFALTATLCAPRTASFASQIQRQCSR